MNESYVIIENLLSKEQCQAIRTEGVKLLGTTGRNSFEGQRTQGVYDVLSKTTAVDILATHPRVMELLDRIFLPGYLLSQSQVINILPGESPQALHYDDYFYHFPRPRQALERGELSGAGDILPAR